LIQGIELEELKTLYSKMKSDWKLNRKLAPANFLRAFVETQKRASGKPLWIDTTPINLFRSNELAPFLPGARFIHMVRDGRDVISSVTREHWGPRTYDEGLTWYRRRMRRILLNTNELDSRVLTISLEDLAIHNRSESLNRILSFLGLENESKLQKYFEAEVTPEKVSRGRWQEEVSDVKKFNESYLKIVAELKGIDPSVPLES